MKTVVFAVPTYNRAEILKVFLQHIDHVLQVPSRDLKFKVLVYDNPKVHEVPKEVVVSDTMTYVTIAKTKDVNLMGEIRYDKVQLVKEYYPEADWMYWMDDDCIIDGGQKFVDELRHVLEVADIKDYSVVSLNKRNCKLSMREFPSASASSQYIPYTEKGILIRMKDIDKIITPRSKVLSRGEDSFVFFEAMMHRLKCGVVKGVSQVTRVDDDPTHPYYGQFKVLGGGYSDNLADHASQDVSSFQQKYQVANKIQGHVLQEYVADLHHYDSAFNQGRRLRPNLLSYIRSNFTQDGAPVSRSLMPIDGSARKAFGKERDFSHLSTKVLPAFKEEL